MDIQEIIKSFGHETNPMIALAPLLYYLVLNWSKIRDGLGFTKDNRTNLTKLEQNYNLLKLRIEIEQLKKNSGLDADILLKLEQEMDKRLNNLTNKAFTPSQKFIAIPLVFILIIVAVLDLQSPNPQETPIDIMSGLVLFLLVIYLGFWGLPILQKQQEGRLKNTCFIIYWSFGFFLSSYSILYFFFYILSDPQLVVNYIAWLFFICLSCSVLLGIFKKLPLSNKMSSERT